MEAEGEGVEKEADCTVPIGRGGEEEARWCEEEGKSETSWVMDVESLKV